MAVGLQDRLGHIAEEMVVAVAMGHVGEFRRDAGDEGVLPVGDPEGHGGAQRLGPLLGPGDQPPDLVGGGREQRLGEPHPLPGQFPDDVEGLVALLRLEAVDRQDDRVDRFVLPPQHLGVLLPRREHDLVMPDVPGQGIVRELDPVRVEQFGSDLGDRPVPGEAAMTDPAQDVPADGPLGQGDGDFQFRALGPGVPGATGVGAVVELADQLDRAVQGMDVAVAVVTDIHPPSTGRAIAVQDIQFPGGEVRVLGPGVRHRAGLPAVVRPSDVEARQELTLRNGCLLALLRTVDFES